MQKNILKAFTFCVAFIIANAIMLNSVYAYTLLSQNQQAGKRDCKATAIAQMLNIIEGKDKYKAQDFYAGSGPDSKNINGNTYAGLTAEYTLQKDGITKDQLQKKIDTSLSNNIPIIIRVHGKKSGATDDHWVTLISKSGSSYKAIDPWGAKVITLSDTYNFGSKSGYFGYVALNKTTQNPITPENYYKKYTGNSASIVISLQTIGVDSTFGSREKIAKANGIANYTSTEEQNIKLLNLLKQGKLKVASTQNTSPSVSYYKKYTGNTGSIVTGLQTVGVDSSFDSRAKIAKANGISNYTATAEQNIKLLNLLKQGSLKKY